MLEALLAWDEHVFRLMNAGWLHPMLDRLMPLVTDARNYHIPFIVGAILILFMDRWRGVRFLVLAIVSVVVADAIATHVFKHAFWRTRPCIALEGVRLLVGCVNSPSFPSNHAVNASALATLVALYRPRLWLAAAALALLVGYSRVYIGAHYPLDVLAGSMLGLTVALALAGVMTLLWPSDPSFGEQRRMFSLKIEDR
jgi:undecaprenyl-diphosphatase